MRKLKAILCAAILSLSALSPINIEAEGATATVNGYTYSYFTEQGNNKAVLIDIPQGTTNLTVPERVAIQGELYDVIQVLQQVLTLHSYDIQYITLNSQVSYNGLDFSGMHALKAVYNMPDYGSLAEGMFRDCPNLDMSLSWLPEKIGEISTNAFAVSGDVVECDDLTIPASVDYICLGAFAGRRFKRVYIPVSEAELGFEFDFPEGKTIYVDRNVHYLNRGLNDDDYCGTETTEEIYNINNPISSLPRCQNLIKLVVLQNSNISLDTSTLEYLDLSGITTNFGTKTIEGEKLATVKFATEITGDLTINLTTDNHMLSLPTTIHGDFNISTGSGKIVVPEVIDGSFFAGGTPSALAMPKSVGRDIKIGIKTLTTIDLSEIALVGDSRHNVEVNVCENLEELHFPKQGADYISYVQNERLKEVYFSGDVTEILQKYNSTHEIIYNGSMEQWLHMKNGLEAVNIHDIAAGFRKGYWSNVSKIWYGHNAKMTYLTDLKITNVDDISTGALCGYPTLKSVEIGTGCKTIGSGAFTNCENLESIELLCESVGNYAFARTPKVSEVIIGSQVKTIAPAAFNKCGSNVATKLMYKGSATQWSKVSVPPTAIADGGFYIKGKLVEDVEFDEPIEQIPAGMFQNVATLKSISFLLVNPTLFGEEAFSNCSSLKTITIKRYSNAPQKTVEEPRPVSLGYRAFYNCSSLTNLDFISEIDELGENALEGTGWMAAQPDGVVCLANRAIKYKGVAPDGTIVKIPDGVTIISYGAFNTRQSGIEGIEFPEGLNTIEYNNFDLWKNLKGTLTFPSTIQTVNASFSADGITKVVIADGGDNPVRFTSQNLHNVKEMYQGKNINGLNPFCESSEKLERLTLGTYVDNIGANYAYHLDNLTRLTVLNATPPILMTTTSYSWDYVQNQEVEVNVNGLSNVDKDKCTLVVPVGSIDAYRAADGWKDFFHVEEIAQTDIYEVESAETPHILGYYNLQGIRSDQPWDGLNIVLYSNGSIEKIYMSDKK